MKLMTAGVLQALAQERYVPALQEQLDLVAGEGRWEDTRTVIRARVECADMEFGRDLRAPHKMVLEAWAQLKAETIRALVPIPPVEWREVFRGAGCE